MAKLPIIIAPDPILRTQSQALERVGDEVRRLMDDMFETMIAGDGIGLAAIQVGLPKCLIVIHVAEDEEEPVSLKLVNPVILWQSDERSVYEEGCLSLPDHLAEVSRPAKARLSYLDENGEACEIEAGGLLATCLQHEVDHLSGTLFIDHLSVVKRNIIIRKLRKAKRTKAALA